MANTEEIEIRINSVEQLFNGLDPSPFREREVDREAERHIVAYAREIAAPRAITLAIYLRPENITPTLAAELEPAIRNHFAHQARVQENELGELRRLGRKGLLVGFLVMLFSTLSGMALMSAYPTSGFVGTLEQALVIFGWVALWRPIEILLYDRWPLIRARQLFERLAVAPVVVRPTRTT